MKRGRKFTIRLRPSIVTLFVTLVLPVFAMTVWVSYASNDRVSRDIAEKLIEKARYETISSTIELMVPIQSLIRTAARLGNAEPDFFRQEKSFGYLEQILAHNPNISSVYTGFNDGSFRMALRVAGGVKIRDQLPPTNATVAKRWLNRNGISEPQDQYNFFDNKGKAVGEMVSAAVYDPRSRFWFKDTVVAGDLSISDAYIFATTGLAGITISMPFYAAGEVAGVVAADITLDNLSKFLASRPVSARALSMIVDDSGRIIAHPDPSEAIRRDDGKLIQNNLSNLSSDLPALATALRPQKDVEQFTFLHPKTQDEYVAMFAKFPPTFGKPWQVLIVAPLYDFTGTWLENNRKLLIYGLIAIFLQVLLIYFLSRAIARPLELLETKVTDVQDFSFNNSIPIESSIREINSLVRAVNKLEDAIGGLSAFVPKDLVKQLLSSEQKLELGGRSRFLTIFFSDLESFSTLAESSPSQQLLLRVSAYLEAVTTAVNQESGTLDKFIGDGVMAFWGAPALLENHALHACIAALRVQQNMKKLNEQWLLEGLSPFNVRIGIHCDAVLVGNIGSKERLSYTVMGDGVNVAARLEGVNKEFGTNTCVSHSVLREAGEHLWLRPIGVVPIKGRRSEIEIYELVGVRGFGEELDATPAQIRLCMLTRQAYKVFRADSWSDAAKLYQDILQEYPDDALSAYMVRQCTLRSGGTSLR